MPDPTRPQESKAFSALERPKLSQSIVDQILESLRRGDYEPGQSLPAERVLADQFGVGRGSVREALRVLEYAGIVEVRVGSGISFTSRALTKSSIMRAQAALVGDHSPLDILTARMAVEPVCARVAASAHRPTDLDRLGQSLEEQRAVTEAGGDPSEPDAMFHIVVAQATGNDVLHGISTQLIELMREGTWSKMKARTRADHEGAVRFLHEHEVILEAIIAGDPAGAEAAMQAHLNAIEQRFLEVDE
mgnify:CR=1 FL=1